MREEMTPEAVLAACSDYANTERYEWSCEDGIGTLEIPYGFYEEAKAVHIQSVDRGVNIVIQLAKDIPHAFYTSTFKLHPVTDGRVTVYEGVLRWCGTFHCDVFATPSGIQSLIEWAMREAFIAESLLRLYCTEQRQILWPYVVGFGSDSEFAAEQ